MHAFLCKFHTEVPIPQLAQGLKEKMGLLISAEGLVMKTYLAVDEHNAAGFYVFTSREHADACLQGAFYDALRGNPAISNIHIQHFDVLDEPSKIFGTPMELLASKAAA